MVEETRRPSQGREKGVFSGGGGGGGCEMLGV